MQHKLNWADRTLEIDLPLECKFVVKGKTPRNVIVTCHGYGDNATNFAALASEIPIDDVLWVNAQGPELLPYAFGGAQWYALQGDPRPGIATSHAALTELIQKICATTGLPSQKCFLFGFSQGCFMTLQVGLTFKTPLAGLIGLSGYCGQAYHFSPAPDFVKQTPIFIAHGLNDQVVFPHMFYQTLDVLNYLGCKRVFHKTYTMEHTICNEEIFDIKAFIEANR